MTVLIVEGPDGAGKTTLIQRLCQRLDVTRVDHHGAYLGERLIAPHYLESLRAGLWRPGEYVIMDRSWLAEPIYGAVMRGVTNRVPRWQARMLTRVAIGADALVIKCLPPYEVCEAAWRERLAVEYPQREDQLRNIYDHYAAASWPELPVITYDYTIDAEASELITQLLVYPPLSAGNPGPGIGALARRVGIMNHVLLVGDRVNPLRGYPGLPFVSFYGGGCSRWLAERLDEWGVEERRLYWVNQHELRVGELAEVMKTPFDQAIALGSHAAAWCEYQLNSNLVKKRAHVEHPQYWKRFHRDRPYNLEGYLK